mmetsp:Transcript_1418/g.3183  ORF Transcript_1418/g.3183 Transcript_1418/m.3183 type:complete len:378 (-) Transcript_1418:1413-2546(-)
MTFSLVLVAPLGLGSLQLLHRCDPGVEVREGRERLVATVRRRLRLAPFSLRLRLPLLRVDLQRSQRPGTAQRALRRGPRGDEGALRRQARRGDERLSGRRPGRAERSEERGLGRAARGGHSHGAWEAGRRRGHGGGGGRGRGGASVRRRRQQGGAGRPGSVDRERDERRARRARQGDALGCALPGCAGGAECSRPRVGGRCATAGGCRREGGGNRGLCRWRKSRGVDAALVVGLGPPKRRSLARSRLHQDGELRGGGRGGRGRVRRGVCEGTRRRGARHDSCWHCLRRGLCRSSCGDPLRKLEGRSPVAVLGMVLSLPTQLSAEGWEVADHCDALQELPLAMAQVSLALVSLGLLLALQVEVVSLVNAAQSLDVVSE